MSYKKVLLVKPKGRSGLGHLTDLIPIGLEYIAASIEKEVDNVWIIDMEFENHSFKYFIDKYQPDLIGISMSATEHKEGLYLAKIAKDNNITTILGGYHPTAIANELLASPYIDMIVRGEGELAMKELVQRGDPEGVKGISYKKENTIINNPDRQKIENLDSLPFPARRLRKHHYKFQGNNGGREKDVISMSRGCYGGCSFCCEPYMSGELVRFRSPENIMEEIMEIVSFHKGKPLRIFVTDPNFISDPTRIDHLCDLLQKHKLDIIFSIMTRVDSIVQHPELVKKMCDSGFLNYEMGFESPDLKDLNCVNKNISLDNQLNAVKILRENGAEASGTFIIGLPGQKEEDIKKFPAYAKKIGLLNCAFGIATPFPKTKFYEKLEKADLIFEQDWTKYDEMHSVFHINSLTPEKLEYLQTYCMLRFWTLDVLLDKAKVLQVKTGQKKKLNVFVHDLISKLEFLNNAGHDLRKDKMVEHVGIFLDAVIDAEKDECKKISMDEAIEMSKLLRILGPQVIQISLKYGGKSASYIFKTSSKKVEQIKTIPEKQEDATIDINVDLKEVVNSFDNYSLFSISKNLSLVKQMRNTRGVFNLARLSFALTAVLSFSYLENKLRPR
ncbi:MAG: B12-binding domain-containing radical SAM protein [Candidatus Methanofastidiosum sp.]|nr:B12-binding domain-containing radical SAM protein [Methanofastidiosum sp.]